jgi:AbrB family looped-hinge helix DNA binding protein
MDEVVRDLEGESKSAKIRALNKAGFKRSEIADFLGCRYQFVRNVLVDEARKANSIRTDEAASLKEAAPLQPELSSRDSVKVKIDEEGRIAIPRSVRDRLGLKPGDALIASAEDGEIHLLTIPTAVRKVQEIIRRYVPKDVSLVDELLEERRREADAESRE